ncbi:MAG: hypothetical protein GTN80_05395 [Nitrososphaeria archaeon]|nr:hypothetical protein [Nitrososphaeria archaeon]NIN52554.1 hypothetical protein [Nitrososphaeria archaeon]NIQ33061.1 hypothetical protein [Nitrososphaeria archaeon]
MYYWRAKIGMAIPSDGSVTDMEFLKIAPEGVYLATTRILHEERGSFESEYLLRSAQQIENAVRILVETEPNVIAVIGDILPIYLEDADIGISKRLQKITDLPILLSLRNEVEAVKALDIKNLAIATPYAESLNQAFKNFFVRNDVNVVKIKGLGINKGLEVDKLPPERAYSLSKELFSEAPEADGVLIACGNFRSLEIISRLEEDLRVPVTTANQAAFWAWLRAVKIREPIKGYGKLLEML